MRLAKQDKEVVRNLLNPFNPEFFAVKTVDTERCREFQRRFAVPIIEVSFCYQRSREEIRLRLIEEIVAGISGLIDVSVKRDF